MPNWVYNTLTIEGSYDMVMKLKQQLGQPFTVPLENHDMGDVYASGGFPQKIKNVTYTNPIFAFWNIVNPFEQGITAEQYACQPARPNVGIDAPNFWEEHHKVSAVDNSWYNWNNRNWGTKWDVAVADGDEYSNTQITDEGANGENYVIVYRFDTAWSPANEVIAKLSEQYPTLLFTNSYEEETGWGGEDEFLAGENTATWDYESKCWECSAEDALELCEDCDMNVCVSCGINDDGDQCEHLGVTKANV